FASSPNSSKAQFFKSRFAAQGIDMEIPRLDSGDFEALTLSSQLDVIDQAVAGRNVMLMGSSLGGYLAALYAARHPNVERVVLLAPAFQFPRRWRERYTAEQLAEWKRAGSVPVYHYGEQRELRLGYQLMEDSVQYEDEPDVHQPALIFHGTKDDVVPSVVSEAFVATHPN